MPHLGSEAQTALLPRIGLYKPWKKNTFGGWLAMCKPTMGYIVPRCSYVLLVVFCYILSLVPTDKKAKTRQTASYVESRKGP